VNWTEFLKSEVETTYSTTSKLMNYVDPGSLEWKPPTGSNWMTVGQLLKHIASGCGAGCKGFVTGDWGLPEGQKIEDLPPEEMLPSAEMLPTVQSVDEARRLLQEDKALALQMIDQAGENELASRVIETPWIPGLQLILARQFLQMIQHLDRHKSQLFYYLKLQGKPVTTVDLWG
jgi:uncharacterized damage-inducible protein DinB